MPRGPRLLEDGSYYHILTRGNDRKRIFRYAGDYSRFLVLARECALKYPVFIFHYCLMGNHIHFLIKTTEARHTPKFFQALFQSYAAYFRKRYRHTGYLFQNRYKSYYIDKETYLLECARYIERNPVRAGIVESISDYRWSSYLYYAEGNGDDIITLPDPLYLEMAKTDADRRRLYKDYILQERPYELLVDKGLRIR